MALVGSKRVGSSFNKGTFGNPPGVTQVDAVTRRKIFDTFFGQPKFGVADIDPYESRTESTWNLPAAYQSGEGSIMISKTIELLAFTADSVLTTIILPMRKVNALTIEWETTEFDAKYTTVVPYRGRSRLLSARKKSGSAGLIRRGIGIELEHGFMLTERGRFTYIALLDQMNTSVVESNNLGVIWCLLNCHSYFNDEAKTIRGKMPAEQAIDRMRIELETFAIFQKSQRPIAALNQIVDKCIKKANGKADTWILPEKPTTFASLAVPHYLDYYLAGVGGPQAANQGVNAYKTLPGSDNRIYVYDGADVSGYETLNLLRGHHECGEYAPAFDIQRGVWKNYSNKNRAVRLYNELTDSYDEISLHQMIESCGRFDPQTGRLKNTSDPAHFRGAAYSTYTTEECDADVFRTPGKGTGMVDVQLYGQIRDEHFTLDDVIGLATTALAAMHDIGTQGDIDAAISGLADVMQYYHSQEYTAKMDNWFYAIALHNYENGTSQHPTLPVAIEEFRSNEHSSLNLPSKDARITNFTGFGPVDTAEDIAAFYTNVSTQLGVQIPNENKLDAEGFVANTNESVKIDGNNVILYPARLPFLKSFRLPPGYCNGAGLLEIATRYAESPELFTETYGWDKSMGKKVHDAVRLLSSVHSHLRKIFPDSALNSASYASSWWHNATGLHTLIEGIVDVQQFPVFLIRSGIDGFQFVPPSGETVRGSGIPRVVRGGRRADVPTRFNAPPGNAGAAIAPRHNALQTVFNLGQSAAAWIQGNLIGALAPMDQETTRGVPISRINYALGADRSATNATLPDDQSAILAFKNRQSEKRGTKARTEADLRAARDLPEFARRRFTAPIADNDTDITPRKSHFAQGGVLSFTTAIENQPSLDIVRLYSSTAEILTAIADSGVEDPLGASVDPAVYKKVYDDLVAYVFNYRTPNTLVDRIGAELTPATLNKPRAMQIATRIANQEVQRAIVLSILSSVNLKVGARNSRFDAPVPLITQRYQKLLAAIQQHASITTTTLETDGPSEFTVSQLLQSVSTVVAGDADLLSVDWRTIEADARRFQEQGAQFRSRLSEIISSSEPLGDFNNLFGNEPRTILGTGAANSSLDPLPGWRHVPDQYTRAPLTLPPTAYLSWFKFVNNKTPAGGTKNVPSVIPADYQNPDQPLDIFKAQHLYEISQNPTAEYRRLTQYYPGLRARSREEINRFSGLVETSSVANNLRYWSGKLPGGESSITSSTSSSRGAYNPNVGSDFDEYAMKNKSMADTYHRVLQQQSAESRAVSGSNRPSDGKRASSKKSLGEMVREKQRRDAQINKVLGASPDTNYSELSAISHSAYTGAKDDLVDPKLLDHITPALQTLFSKLNTNSKHVLIAMIAKVYATCRVTLESAKRMCTFDVVVPWSFYLVHPHIKHRTLTGIKLQAGGQTGYTYMGNSVFVWGDEVSTQYYSGHYTYHARSYVHRPENVCVVKSLFVDGYVGGNSNVMIDLNTYYPERDQLGEEDASLFCFMGAYTERKLGQKIDLTGKFRFGGQPIDMPENKRIHASWIGYYGKMIGWDIRLGLAESSEDDATYSAENAAFNTTLYLGHCLYRNPINGQDIVEPGCGHFGKGLTRVGARAMRDGSIEEFKPADYSLVQILA
jgi:hypothetical protein